MEFLASLSAGMVFSCACNLDTLLLAMGYAVKGVRVPRTGRLIIAAVTTVITWASLALGELAFGALDGGFSEMLGGLVLVGIGAWLLLDYLRHLGRTEDPDAPPPASGCRAWISLAAALAVNNAGVGVAAGVSGIGPLTASVCNFLVTLLFLPLGSWLGTGAPGRLLGRYALPLSGILLVLLGLGEAFL